MWSAIYHIANSTSKPSGIPENLPPDVVEFLAGCFERSWRPSPFPVAYHLNPPHYAPSAWGRDVVSSSPGSACRPHTVRSELYPQCMASHIGYAATSPAGL